MNRRQFLQRAALLAAVPFLPRWAASRRQSDVEVVVIGAGVAGLGAARVLQEAGVSFQLVEAADRIGGRTWTDESRLGRTIDLGAHYFHHGRSNFFRKYAQANGFPVYPMADESWAVFQNGARQSARESAYEAAARGLSRRLFWPGLWRRDVSVLEAAEPLTADEAAVARQWTDGGMGLPLDQISLLDAADAASDDGNWFTPAGLGSVIQHYGRQVPVSLQTSVQAIDASGPRLRVVTNQGVITCRHAVVTVSVGVLQSGAIQFRPGLPTAHLQALDGLQMGRFEHLIVRLRRDVFGLGQDRYLMHPGLPPQLMLSNASGTEVTYLMAPSEHVLAWNRLSDAELLPIARELISQAAGSEAAAEVVQATMARWQTNPLTLGSYAARRPGHGEAREHLAHPVDQRIWFAGEAVAERFIQIQGAHASGQQVAQAIRQALRHSR